MPRLSRLVIPDVPLHIVQRGNNRLPVFFDSRDYEDYYDALCTASRRHQCEIHAYVLMTNHVHLLITPRIKEGPSRMMQAVGRRFVRTINERHQRTGTLWEGRFRSMLVDSENYFLACSRYIELNPVRAGIVDRPDQYQWSSYARNAGGRHDALITEHDVYRGLAARLRDRLEAYQSLFGTPLDLPTLDEIRRATNRGTGVAGPGSTEIALVLRSRASRGRGGDRRSMAFRVSNHSDPLKVPLSMTLTL
jgi:putative transposase